MYFNLNLDRGEQVHIWSSTGSCDIFVRFVIFGTSNFVHVIHDFATFMILGRFARFATFETFVNLRHVCFFCGNKWENCVHLWFFKQLIFCDLCDLRRICDFCDYLWFLRHLWFCDICGHMGKSVTFVCDTIATFVDALCDICGRRDICGQGVATFVDRATFVDETLRHLWTERHLWFLRHLWSLHPLFSS